MPHSISSITRNDHAVTAVWSDGMRIDLPHLWLRDNCGCSECRVVQTTEKRFHLFSVPGNLEQVKGALVRAKGQKPETEQPSTEKGHRLQDVGPDHGLQSPEHGV